MQCLMTHREMVIICSSYWTSERKTGEQHQPRSGSTKTHVPHILPGGTPIWLRNPNWAVVSGFIRLKTKQRHLLTKWDDPHCGQGFRRIQTAGVSSEGIQSLQLRQDRLHVLVEGRQNDVVQSPINGRFNRVESWKCGKHHLWYPGKDLIRNLSSSRYLFDKPLAQR